MFRAKTVLVLGAGASFEAGLPIGFELRDNISRLTRYKLKFDGIEHGDRRFFDELTRGLPGNQISDVVSALSKTSNGISFVSSVDNFLEVHREDSLIQKCAKAAICKEISEAERRSALYVDPSNVRNRLDTSRLRNTWYLELAHIALEKANSLQLGIALDRVSIISFNYDRCAEWFLYNALRGLYDLQPGEAAELLKSLSVIHPYGTIGTPSWLGPGNEVEEFGADMSGRLVHAANRIKTFTEDVSGLPEITKAKEAVDQADNLIFLGFSFHPQNLDLLEPLKQKKVKLRNIYATTLGMSGEDTRVIKQQLESRFSAAVIAESLTCAEFLRQFKRTLSA
jgi:hypothetical protein